ncbi:bifunctional nuclease family protein [Hydrogenivirga sp. 128-5-R1-1]|uniref:bifunctional nuclease family protein n=1 Tax=Hydrogenivirga sp. 128-5-R1-1 TaxID=392423 RepID=UPI00015F1A3B|nr:bifunctional nuclease family protein [Hydrogenivirga sp. 128-5-R1-1]EDP72887.1 hypothetical protein HG1285_10350 [Hydrogenivirga sp. 128-5-R1-1]
MIEMQLQGLTLDPITNMPVIVLKGKNCDDILSIWIGNFEANALSMKIENVFIPRPMTHDLIANLIKNLEAHVSRIIINDLKDNTYYAVIHIEKDGNIYEIDSRPSDAINIALRVDAPIFVEEKVLQKYKNGFNGKINENDIKEWLESLKPEDFI